MGAGETRGFNSSIGLRGLFSTVVQTGFSGRSLACSYLGILLVVLRVRARHRLLTVRLVRRGIHESAEVGPRSALIRVLSSDILVWAFWGEKAEGRSVVPNAAVLKQMRSNSSRAGDE